MKYIHLVEKIFSATTLAVMTCVTFTAAINRFTFHIAMPWSEELVKFLLMWMTMVGAAMGIGTGEHVGINVIIDHLPHRIQGIVLQCLNLAGVAFSVLFCYIGVLMVQKQHMQKSTAMQISMGIVYACVIAGAALMFLEFGYKFWLGLHKEEKQDGMQGGENSK
jgi:C4-dicarboxylate transporter DctQ subunit